MKGQYFSFDALIGALVFVMIVVVAVGMFLSSTFAQKVQEEELRLYALKVANMLSSPYSDVSLLTTTITPAGFNDMAEKVNSRSPYPVSLSIYPLAGGCSFTYPVMGKGMSATLYRVLPLTVRCGPFTLTTPSLVVVTVYSSA